MIITGDPTQIDLPPGQKSGLIEACACCMASKASASPRFARMMWCAMISCAAFVTAYEQAARAAAQAMTRPA